MFTDYISISSQPKFHCRINVVLTLWINVETTLIRRSKWKKIQRRIFNAAQRWYNAVTRKWYNVEITLHNVETTFCNVVLTFLEPSVKVSIESSWASDDYGFVTRSMVLILLSEKILLLIKNTTNKKWKIFLTVVQIVIHNVGNNGDIHRILKYCI